MAKCTYKLPEELLKKLSTLGERIDEVSEIVLNAGANVVLTKVKANLEGVIGRDTKTPSKSTGELVNALGISKMVIDKNGNPNVKIGFREPRSDGKSNAMLANILEYGKHNQPAKPFLKPAKSQSKSECIEAMTKALVDEVNKV